MPRFIRDHVETYGWPDLVLRALAVAVWVPFLFWALVLRGAFGD